jgi:5'-AMP-activated protein kinase catalytic alpha subunit
MENKSLSEIMKDDDIFFQVEIKIGPFKLMNQIGNGKFSTVYLGIHEETGQKVAIKQIKKSEINTNILLAKEINIQKILFHPYLTQLYCVIEKPENIYLISEYCSKGDIITNLIEKGNFKEDFACKIFQQILSSLEYLHKNNITHRDIKPENILLTENYDAKLTDFGLSKYYKENELLSTFCGSPIYASPEMLEGKKYNGTKIDVWGLGISLYTMVCGELPFIIEDENDIKTLINNIINA